MKSLPVGIQTFRKIIKNNQLYVDKTEYIYNLITNEDISFYFLSRPRRFGKSLLISTLEEIFLGNKELFSDLWIYDKYDWKKYPVIRLDFAGINSSTPDVFKQSISNLIVRIGKKYDINLDKSSDYKENFSILIEEMGKIEKVVILIDEYDKPIVDFIEDLRTVEQNKQILKSFYVTLKTCDQYIKFAFLTGVSKFSRVSVFSDLNNLTDLTLDKNYSKMLGYTQAELEYYFDDRIKILAEEIELSFEETKKELKTWYNGYSWDGINFVYNPFSILNVLKDKQINNYWFMSGTPTFLIKLLKSKEIDIQSLEDFKASKELLDSFEIENINIQSLLFQTGYLTIKEIKNPKSPFKKYILNYPNMEVKESLLNNILKSFTESSQDDRVKMDDLVECINNNDLDMFFKIIFDMFAHIPHEIFMKDKEAYYHSIIYIILTLIGVRIGVEIETNKGRIDAVIETLNNIYIMEFKLNYVNNAINQIEEKKYYEGYLLSKKPVYLVGVSFDPKDRNIKEWKSELLILR